MAADAKRLCHHPRGRDLARVDLTVTDRQRMELVALGPRHGARGVGVETAAE